MTTTRFEHLTKQIEHLIQDHVSACRRAAEEAVARAFASTSGGTRQVKAKAARSGRRRTGAELEFAAESLHRAVCERPGETMAIMAGQLGTTVRELQRPMGHLKAKGAVRSVGQRHLTRYFPVADKAAKSA